MSWWNHSWELWGNGFQKVEISFLKKMNFPHIFVMCKCCFHKVLWLFIDCCHSDTSCTHHRSCHTLLVQEYFKTWKITNRFCDSDRSQKNIRKLELKCQVGDYESRNTTMGCCTPWSVTWSTTCKLGSRIPPNISTKSLTCPNVSLDVYLW